MDSSTWVVVGTYEDDAGRWTSEVFAEGFATQEDANRYRGDLARRCPEVGFEAQPAVYAGRWVTK